MSFAKLLGMLAASVSGATIEYSYITEHGDTIPTAAEISWPTTKPRGVILYWHGTNLAGLPQFGSTPEEEFAGTGGELEALATEYVIVMPHQLGLGLTKLTHNQLWQWKTPVQNDGDAALTAVYTKAQADYSLADGERLPLYITGHSQGGTSSLVYHLHIQTPNSAILSMYQFQLTIASAGHYSVDVWEATMSDYADFTEDALMQLSFSSPNMPLAKEFANVLLTHLLHTYKVNLGATDAAAAAIEYAPGAEDMSNPDYKDDWTQMGLMIGQVINGQDDSMTEPAFLTSATWTALKDSSSSLRQGLNAYLRTQYDGLASGLASNALPIELVFACNDLNVPCAHSLSLPQTAPHVTFTNNSPAVPDPLADPFESGHHFAQLKWAERVVEAAQALDTVQTHDCPTGCVSSERRLLFGVFGSTPVCPVGCRLA